MTIMFLLLSVLLCTAYASTAAAAAAATPAPQPCPLSGATPSMEAVTTEYQGGSYGIKLYFSPCALTTYNHTTCSNSGERSSSYFVGSFGPEPMRHCFVGYNNQTTPWVVGGHDEHPVSFTTSFESPDQLSSLKVTVTCDVGFDLSPAGKLYTVTNARGGWDSTMKYKSYFACANATSSPPLATTTNSVAPLPTNTVAPELPPSAPPTSPEDGCTKFNLCSSCTSAPSGSCGFCAVTKTCMNGNSQGPLHGQCGGSSWEWYASKCVNE